MGFFVYRELKPADLAPLLAEAVEITAIPVFILASASIFGWLLAFHGFGQMVVDVLSSLGLGRIGTLAVIVLMLLLIGLVIEGLAALIIFVPVFMPMIPAFGFDDLQFALIVIVTILIGTVTPPVGLQLYIAAAIGKTSLSEITVWPFVFAMVGVVAVMVLFTPFVVFLPRLILG